MIKALDLALRGSQSGAVRDDQEKSVSGGLDLFVQKTNNNLGVRTIICMTKDYFLCKNNTHE